jgi:type I restriction enzyme S subunit
MGKVGLSGKYQTYPEYKYTGKAWLPAIPKHWEVLPLKLISANKVKDGPHETPEFLSEGIPFFSVDGIQNNKLVFEGCRYISREDHERYSVKCLPKFGDVLLGKAASVGKVAFVDTKNEFNVWSPLAVLTPKSTDLGKFIFYSIQSTWVQAQCDVNSNSNTQKNLSMGDIDNLFFGSPPDKEAIQIANFLDHETAKIDTLIEKQQQLIKLLKEKRQAVISHAVTKGLNPNAPMRDSGVEWLGEVPEDWTVTPLKYVCKLIDGDRSSTYPNDGDLVDKGIPFVSSKNIVNFKLTKKNLNYITIDKYKALGRGKLANGDLVITVRGTIGHVGIFDQEVIGCHTGFINAQMMIMRPNFGLTNYLQSISESSSWLGQLDIAAYGSTVRQLSNEILGNIIIAIPPVSEIHNFIESVNSEILKFEGLISKAELGIQLMQERRTALISAAVTGKIDVRDWVAPESSNNTIDSRLRGNDAELNAAVDLNKVADLSKEAGL